MLVYKIVPGQLNMRALARSSWSQAGVWLSANVKSAALGKHAKWRKNCGIDVRRESHGA